MDNYQSNNVIMQLDNIAQLLKTQNELIQKLLQPQEDERTRTRKILQEAIRRAEEMTDEQKQEAIKEAEQSWTRLSSSNNAEYIIP